VGNDKYTHNGKTWFYGSAEALASRFPYWRASRVRRVIADLINTGVILRGNYNKHAYDRTSWYAFVDENAFLQNNDSISHYEQMDHADLPKASAKVVTPIQDNGPYNGEDKNRVNAHSDDESLQTFEEFWTAYPRKQARGKAVIAWKSTQPDLQVVLDAIKVQKQSTQWQDPQYIPLPANYINDCRWEDEEPEFISDSERACPSVYPTEEEVERLFRELHIS
jgi:hypothetical protein